MKVGEVDWSERKNDRGQYIYIMQFPDSVCEFSANLHGCEAIYEHINMFKRTGDYGTEPEYLMKLKN